MMRKRLHSTDLARLLIWSAARMVPNLDRREWTAEWSAELCHIGQSDACDPVQFSLGAFHDAFWLRSDRVRSRALAIFPPGSAPRGLLILGMLTISGLLMCVLLPGARRVISPDPYQNPANLFVISSKGYEGTLAPSISLSDYRGWKIETHNLFSQIAYYHPALKHIHLHPHGKIALTVAITSTNILQVLNFTNQNQIHLIPGQRQLILSQSAWALHFGSNPDWIGKTVLVADQPVVIAGILPNRQWRLPGKLDALLIEDGHSLAMLPGNTKGFVIARLSNSAALANRPGWRSMFEEGNGADLHFDCIPFSSLLDQPCSIFLFGLLMACISLPATTPLHLGNYPERYRSLPGNLRTRRWTFLLIKLLLVLSIVGSWSIALAYGFSAVDSSFPIYVQAGISFPALLIALRWVLHDQRKRCPVCLRTLSNPARVGHPSCNFLAWCGTELVCLSGHGLLHIPEMPTSWFDNQRWLGLDASWTSLFPASCSSS